MTDGFDSRRALLVDAFADAPLSGNAAGVVPDAEGLSEGRMQAVARELAVSETAFLLPAADADRRVRFFTPTREVDLCGHATVASHALLHADGVVEPGEHSLATAAGEVTVTVEDDGTTWYAADRPSVREVDLDYEAAAEALGVPPVALREVGRDLAPAVAEAGFPWLLVPVTYLEHLGAADPDPGAVTALADAHDAEGVYAFTFDALDPDSTLHARAFAPGAGIPEDPVTGTASAGVATYLRSRGAVDATGELRLEQGHFVDRPGLVRVQVEGTVRVGGRAAVALDGTVRVPPGDDDEIIEA
jgi:PhzF family phenazine biosynthesis protein